MNETNASASSHGLVIKPLHTLRGPSPASPPPAPAPAGGPAPALLLTAAAVLLAIAVGAGLAGHRSRQQLLDGLDREVFARADQALAQTLADKQARALASVRLLVDDTRVRATVITPNFDEATVADVLEDLRAASGASVVAVLNVAGKVKARVGADLRDQVDLGSVTAVRSALEGPAAAVWTLPEHVLVTAVAPIRSGAEVSALLMLGYELGGESLAPIERLTQGLGAAVAIGDRLVAFGSSGNDPARKATFEAARSLAEADGVVGPASSAVLVHTTRTGSAATAGRVLWTLPRHHQQAALGALPVVGLMAPVLFAFMFGLLALGVRRR